jgi:hypothetical protein
LKGKYIRKQQLFSSPKALPNIWQSSLNLVPTYLWS